MAKNEFDKLSHIGHTIQNQIKSRLIEYFVTPSGKMPAKEWLESLKDKVAQAILYKRIRQAGTGNFGKTRHVGNGVQELKIDYGPGYRIYFGVYKDEMILLLLGGSKRTQQADIEKSRAYWIKWMEDQSEN